MNTNRTFVWLVVVGVVVTAGSAAAQTLTPSYVNLFRHVDMDAYKQTGVLAFDSAAQWFLPDNDAWVAKHQDLRAIDGGANHAQYDFAGGSNYATNEVSLRMTLADAQSIGSLAYYTLEKSNLYRVWAFNDPADMNTWTLLTVNPATGGWLDGTAAPTVSGFYEYTVNVAGADAYKYVQIDFCGMPNNYIRVAEAIARPKSDAEIGLTSGYNLLSFRLDPANPDAGGIGSVPAGSLYRNGWRYGNDDPNKAVDGNPLTYLVQEDPNSTATLPNHFALPLNDLYALAGFSASMYPSQSWSGIAFLYTDDEEIDEDTKWKTAYTTWDPDTETWGAFNTSIITFDEPVLARYIRVEAPLRTGNGALCEIELFAVPIPPAIPEPVTLALLAMGGLAMLRRRT